MNYYECSIQQRMAELIPTLYSLSASEQQHCINRIMNAIDDVHTIGIDFRFSGALDFLMRYGGNNTDVDRRLIDMACEYINGFGGVIESEDSPMPNDSMKKIFDEYM